MVASVHLAYFSILFPLESPYTSFGSHQRSAVSLWFSLSIELCRLQSLKLSFMLPLLLKVPQIIVFPLLLALHTLVSLFSFQGAVSNFFRSQIQTLTLLCKCLNPISDLMDNLVGPSGLEPPTSRLSVVRSSQLSYGPVWLSYGRRLRLLVEINGIEPLTPCLQSRCSPS